MKPNTSQLGKSTAALLCVVSTMHVARAASVIATPYSGSDLLDIYTDTIAKGQSTSGGITTAGLGTTGDPAGVTYLKYGGDQTSVAMLDGVFSGNKFFMGASLDANNPASVANMNLNTFPTSNWLWWDAHFATPIELSHFVIRTADAASQRTPDQFQIRGSNDDANWTVIYRLDANGNGTGTPWGANPANNTAVQFDGGGTDFATPAAYRHIRLEIFSATGNGDGVGLTEWQVAGQSVAINAFWKGSAGNLWSDSSNFATDQSGSPDLAVALDASRDVIFNATGAANFASTDLGGNQTVNSVIFGSDATSPVGIGGTGTLTLTSFLSGIKVLTGSGDHTIGNGVTVALGGNQSWVVTDPTQTLTVGGTVTAGGKTLTKSGAGTLTLNGSVNNATGEVVAAAGTLNLHGGLNVSQLTVSGGSATLGAGSTGTVTTMNVGSGSALLATGAGGTITTLNVSGGSATVDVGATTAITTMNVSGGSATVSAATVTTLSASAGSTTLGAAVTALNVSGTASVLGAAGAAATTATVTGGTINTQGNYLSVAGSMNMTGGNIVASGAPFGVRGSSITPSITSLGALKLDGGTVTVNMTAPQSLLSEDFNSMGPSGTTPPAGWSLLNPAGDSNTWGASISLNGVTMNTTSGLTALDNPSGVSSANGYNALGVTGRAIATSPTGTAGSVIQSPQILNNTGGALTSFDISYDIKRFTTGNETVPGYWLFYSLDGTTWTNVSGLNPTVASTPPFPNVPNSAGTTNIATTTVTLSSPWNNGTNLRLRWADDNSSNSSPDQTIGLDNVLVKFNATGPVNLPTTDLVATSNTTLNLNYAGAAVVHDVSLDSGIALTVQTATSLSLNDLTGASGSQLLASGMGLTIASGSDAGSITAASVTKTSTGVLQLDGAQTYNTLTVEDGTLNVNGILTTGTAAVSVTDTVGGAPTTLRFGTVSQTLSSLTIGAGATVVFTSGTATGAFGGGGKGLSVVPEPGTLGLLLLGALGVLNRRRREAGRL